MNKLIDSIQYRQTLQAIQSNPRLADHNMSNYIIRNSLLAFARASFRVTEGTKFEDNWHIDLICDYLTACFNREIRKLIINIPPRCMKSLLVSVDFPAWLLGNNPTEKIIVASYSQSLANKLSTKCRTIINSPFFKQVFPKLEMMDDNNQVQYYRTKQGGHRYATSVGGTITGEGGNFLIIDDPIKASERHSDIAINNANTWYSESFINRMNDRRYGVEIVIMQRMAQHDLTGYLMEQGGYELLKIPFEVEKKTIVEFKGNIYAERVAGDILIDRIGTPQELIHGDMGGDGGLENYETQYLQNPSVAGGGIFKEEWFNYYKELPHGGYRVISIDTASKVGELNDYSVATIWQVIDNKYYLVGIFKDRLIYPSLKTKVSNLIEEHNPQLVLIEDKASGTQLIQDFKQHPYPIRAVVPKQDKIVRASNTSTHFEMGRVFFPETQAKWLHDYKQELLSFPNAKHDDQVDSTSQFLNYIKLANVPRARVL